MDKDTSNSKETIPGPLNAKPKRVYPTGLAMARHKRDEVRYRLAETAVAAGATIPQAMRTAGYSESTIKHSDYPIRRELIKARDNYLKKYCKSINRLKLDGKSTAERLAKIIHGKDDYNANAAIKTHVMILLKNAPQNDHSLGFLGVFVVPGQQSNSGWEGIAKAIPHLEAETLVREATITDESHNGVTTDNDTD